MKKSIQNYLHLTASEYNNNGCHDKNIEVNTTLLKLKLIYNCTSQTTNIEIPTSARVFYN